MKKIQDSLAGKVVIITGGTRGIGYATTKAFLENGAKVAMLGSRQETVDQALANLREENKNYEVRGYYPNLTNSAEIQAMVKDVCATWGTVDILINNAGISDGTPILNYDEELFDNVMDINIKSVYMLIREVVPIMKEKKSGVIINTSSMVSIYAQRSGFAYPTSKFALNGLTKSLARELGASGIRVNAVAPGVTKTDMVAALDNAVVAAISSQIPLARVGKPEEVADAFLFLASDMASYISGEILSVDGAIVA